MSDQFVAEIRIVPFYFAPVGWAICNGQLLPISQNTALFSLLGTTYGGNGTSNFALPNLQGSVPLDFGQGAGLSSYVEGQIGGETTVTLTTGQMPAHTHSVSASSIGGDVDSPIGNVFSTAHMGKTPTNMYAAATGSVPAAMSPQAVAPIGGGQPHNNLQPYLVLNFVIALQGIFPARS
ncbi:MAG TPA: tail fiber protein [Candidatus Saccharimonadales bacterium]|nr:tail fiber protein [Candidatus Saccharimonadales bacterium]